MAIINTLQKCLDSPYLFQDPEAPGRVASLLKFAGDRLDAARKIQKSAKPDPADIGSLAYEAMFAASGRWSMPRGIARRGSAA